MSLDINSVFFGGRLVADPEKVGDNGCKFDIANNRYYKDKSGETVKSVTYMSITCWGPQSAAVMEYCTKGDSVVVQGRLEVRKVEDREGNTRKYTNIVAQDVRFMNTRQKEDRESVAKSTKLPEGVDSKTMKILKQILANDN